MRCAACGAGIAATDPACPYCGQMTPHGAWHAQQQKQHEHAQAAYQLHREHTEQLERAAAAKLELKNASSRALYWSLGGLVTCCAFVPSIVGLVFALKARKLANATGLAVPGSATTALVLSLVGVLSGLGIVGIAVQDAQERSARLEEIEKLLGEGPKQAVLAQPIGCLLAERRLLTEGWKTNKSFSDFECDGRLQQTADRGVLSGIRFEVGQERPVLAACLQKGERWSVRGFSTTECKEPEFQPPK
jgi:hypothetical protein